MKANQYIWPLLFCLLGVFIGWLIWGRSTPPLPPLLGGIKSDTVTIHDTVNHNIPVPYPFPIKGDTQWVPVPANVDTTAILARYFAKVFYKHPFADSNIDMTITDTISQNAIISRKISYKLLKPFTTIQNTTITPPLQQKRKWGFYAQANVSIMATNPSLGAGITVLTPERFGFGLNYDILNNNTSFSLLYRLNK